jgi:hypothetical protein
MTSTTARRALRGSAVASLAVAAVASPLLATAAHADDVNRGPGQSVRFTPAQNNPLWWGAECYKLEDPADPFPLDATAGTLVIKAGTTLDIWSNANPGLYGSASGKNISYVIVCPGGFNS